MMVSLVISLIGIGAALAVLAAQNASVTKQTGVGSAVAQGELALDVLERAIRLAGTGIDPQLAFDFDSYRCQFPGVAGVGMTESANCGNGVRDARNAPDELVLAYRDPAYSVAATTADTRAGCDAGNAKTFVGKVWGVTAATNSSVSLVLKPGDTILPGQVLQIVCIDGLSYTYATASNSVSVLPTAAACSTLTVTLYTNANARDPYNQPGFLSTACFSAGGVQSARAYAVRRNRFFIRRDLNGPAPHTYLMLDQGLDLNSPAGLGDEDLLPVAADIEDLQVAYATEQPGILALSTPPTGWVQGTYVKDSDANGIWGDDPAAAAAEQMTGLVFAGSGNVPTAQFDAANAALFAGTGQNCTGFATNPFYQYPCLLGTPPVETSRSNNIHAYRWTAWPGNISQVLVGVVARSPTFEAPELVTVDERTIPALLNRPAANAPGYPTWYSDTVPTGHKRVVIRTGVRPVNIALSRLFWN
jgi:hypothetical protein